MERITEWAREFNREFDEEAGWRSETVRAEHLAVARRLQAALQAELGDAFSVELDPMGSGLNPV